MRFLSDSNMEIPAGAKEIDAMLAEAVSRPDGILHEHEVYRLLGAAGIDFPSWHYHAMGDSTEALEKKLPHAGPFVAKVVIRGTTHKTDVKGLAFNVTSDKAADCVDAFAKKFAGGALEGILFVEQIDHDRDLAGEMLVGLYQDPFFGPCVALGFGGTSAEHYKKIMLPHAAQVYMPAAVELSSVEHILKHIPVVELVEGRVRGTAHQISYESIMSAIALLQRLGRWYSPANPKAPFVIEELEMNPAIAVEGRFVALDGVLRARKNDRPAPPAKPLKKISMLLNPCSVAIAGASGKNPANPSNIILKKFLKGGLSRESIYLIHPKEEEIEGIRCVKDLGELLAKRDGKPVDCLVVGVPAKIAGAMVSECFDTYAAHSLQIISAGFGETEAGCAMQQDLSQRLARLDRTPEKRPVVNGPNTLGNVYRGMNTLFTPQYKSSGTGRGKKNAALICQSGAYMITRISDLADSISPSVGVSVGNQMDLSVTDFFEHLLNEDGISSYGLYIEGLNPGDGIRLMKLVEGAQERGKFVVVYKAGRTEAGMTAAKGHTAAMAGDYDMFAHLMRRAGAMVAESFEEFDDLTMLSAYCDGLASLTKLPQDERLGVAALSNAGFEKCAIADHLTATAPKTVELARYGEATRERLKGIFVDHGIANIVDIGDVLDLSPMMNDEGYEKIVRATLEDENVDFGIYAVVPETGMLNTCEPGERHREDLMREGSILNRLVHIRRDSKKPFVVSFESGKQYARFRQELLNAGIPCFSSADAAARTVALALDSIRRDVI